MTDGFEELFSKKTEYEAETETATTVDTEVTETVEETAQETVDEPAEVEGVRTPTTEAAPAEEAKTGLVPLAALQAERERAKTLRLQSEARQARINELERASSQTPDPYDDPAAYTAHFEARLQAEVQAQLIGHNLNQSRARAAEKYGEGYILELSDWAAAQAESDPLFEAKVLNSPDPVEHIVSLKKRHDLMKEVETDPDAYVRRRALELGLAATAPAVEALQLTPTKSLGPKSIASASSREISKGTTSGDSFDAIFK